LPSTTIAARVAFYGVIACWWWFALTFWLRKRPPRAHAAKRDLTSYFGMALQAAAYFWMWDFPFLLHRGSPIASKPRWLAWTMTALALAIGVSSAWLVNAAARRLGKQWSLAARIVHGHELIDDGPYHFVRNPIYTGMLGMLVATGLIISPLLPLLLACAIFLAGTYIRVRVEERLLRETFGPRFDDYARRVPAMIPGIW
jgi:protein-S-isoprenylcysteine O-methyltransferase Ste14